MDVKAGYPGGTWLVHDGDYPEVDVGMVSDGHGFEDSPDCERIAGGEAVMSPFTLLGYVDDPARVLSCARNPALACRPPRR